MKTQTKTHVAVTLAAILMAGLSTIFLAHGTQPETESTVIQLDDGTTSQVSVEEVSSQTEEPEQVDLRYGFSDHEIYILAQLLCGDKSVDGDGEYDFVWGALNDEMNYYEMSKVLCVVMNRVRHDDFPDTVDDVIFQPRQFQFGRNKNSEPHDVAIEQIAEWCDAYDNYDPGVQCIPENHLYFEAGPNLTNTTSETWR